MTYQSELQNMDIDRLNFIGETTTYDKKEKIERNKSKSWLKSVSAFANGEGGTLIFGISDNNEIIGLTNAEEDAESISEAIKTKLDPILTIDLKFKELNGKKLIFLYVNEGQETPYYYIGDKQRLAYIRIGNETVITDRVQLKQLVMKGSGRTFDSLPSPQKFENMAFTKLKSVHYKRLQRSFEDSEFVSWGILDEAGKLTNAGALLADDSPMRQSRIFCTRWNGLTMTNGLGEAIDDIELEGSVIGQLQDAVTFIRNNSHKRWWKENDHREELPDYPERAVTETVANAIIHRDYMQMGSEIHVDMYDDRLEIYSPGGMMDGKLIQQLNPLTVPSKRRNPLLADFFSRLGLMERRGSGMRKIIDAYKQYEHLTTYHAPEFNSNSSEFHVTLWNLNYVEEKESEFLKEQKEFRKEGKEFRKEQKEFRKEGKEFRKEFLKVQRKVYKMISLNPKTTIPEMALNIGVSERQVYKYIKKMTDLNLIIREGGRKNGSWKIIDKEYEGFFDKI